MTIDRCDGCHEPLGDVWTALSGPVFACAICAPILTRIDTLVEFGHLTPEQAADEFTRSRWPAPAREGVADVA